jgi:predicted phosphodiesterase
MSLGIPTVECKLSPESPDLRILVASDWHLGSNWCDNPLVDKVLAEADRKKSYIILAGDMLEMAIKRSVGGIHEQNLTPQQQLEEMDRLFGHRSARILGVLTGNHEGRIARESDVDIVAMWCSANKVPYLNKAGAISVQAHGQTWVIYAQHGVRGTGRKPGASLNAIHDMAENVVADIYLHGHHHRASVTRSVILRHKENIGFYWQRRWFINTGTMHRYGGYASDGAYPPTDVGCYLLYLSKAKKSGKYLKADYLDRQYFGMNTNA